jgi:16S rRNA (guanine966-N2)-methyltransferase
MMGEIKIIGGRYKGRKIKVAEMPDLRPTPNRLRETLFNVIQYDLKHAKCLDAFAGTGALGLEAFSRGAEQVIFLESNPKVYKQLLENLNIFKQDSLEAIAKDCINYLQTTSERFDIIFFDPPFKQNLWESCCEIVLNRKLLNPSGLIYLESPHQLNLDPYFWSPRKQDKLSDVFYGIYELI